MGQMLEAIIFDLDGVLIHTEDMKVESWKRTLEKYNIKDGDSWYAKQIGTPGKKLAEIAVRDFSLPCEPESIFSVNREIYLSLLSGATATPISSSLTFLKSIPKTRYKIGLASSEYKAMIEHQVRRLGIYELFDSIVSGVDEVKNDKPHPEIYLLIARKLNVDPMNCIAIEDSSTGVISAKSAGMKCIGYQNSHSQDLSMADIVVDGLTKLKLPQILQLFA